MNGSFLQGAIKNNNNNKKGGIKIIKRFIVFLFLWTSTVVGFVDLIDMT
jgi:hypothetical protein